MSNKSEYRRDFNEESYGETVDSLNTVLDNGLLLGSNLGGQIIENIKLPVGENVAISHNLKVTPKYRIILRQSGGLVITDGDLEWDDKKIYLKAIGTSSTFTKAIGFKTYDTISPLPPDGGNVSSSFTSGAGRDYGYINSNIFNDALSSGSSDTEATVTIIIMRG